MNETCGCCEGIEILIPQAIANRPGLSALAYRVGTHASFLETMKARLPILGIALKELGIPLSKFVDPETIIYPLRGLTTHAANDPAIAMLDAWATVADVLTFYQERIANEGYLRTAIERRSILELGKLVGYTLRPGVAASVYLAYMLEKDQNNVVILPGNRVQSLPGPGELPQTFETAEKLEAHYTSNILKQRMHRPQYITFSTNPGLLTGTKDGAIYFQGTATNLKPGDPLLFYFGDEHPCFCNVRTVETQAAENRTKVTVYYPPPIHPKTPGTDEHQMATESTANRPHGRQTENIARRQISPQSSIDQIWSYQSYSINKLVELLKRASSDPTTLSLIDQGNIQVSSPNILDVLALRVKAAPLGHNAPPRPILDPEHPGVIKDYEEWLLNGSVKISISLDRAGNEFKSVSYTVERDNTKEYLPHQGSLQEVNLNGLTITPKNFKPPEVSEPLEVFESPKVQIISTSRFQVRDLHKNLINTFINMGVDNKNHWIIRIDGDTKYLISQDYSAQYSTEKHKVEIEAKSNQDKVASITVTVEFFLPPPPSGRNVLPLDAVYEKIVQGSWVVIARPDKEPIICKVSEVTKLSKVVYGITSTFTQLKLIDPKYPNLEKPWLFESDTTLANLRNINVYCQSESLGSQGLASVNEPVLSDISITSAHGQSESLGSQGFYFDKDPVLAEEPIDDPIGDSTIELDGVYDGLKPGQLLIVTGERTDARTDEVLAGKELPVSGVWETELVRLARAELDVQKVPKRSKVKDGEEILRGDKLHTFLILEKPLEHTYKRDTVTIYGNVVRATHGETRTEVLGGGDGTKALQRFTLRQPPLTYTSAPTAAGAESTLEVRVNDILWHEAEDLAVLKPTDHSYITETDEPGKTTVIFGNGQHGSRIPTGVENVKAVYRTGIGKAGNVKAGQITLLATRPLGVKEVTNPQEATGGADKESNDSARRNVPLALMALDRLVSVRDYEDFTRTYAGIGKASAVRLSDGRRQYIYLTIAGADNIPIEPTSDLRLNLFQSLRKFGDPNQPLWIDIYMPRCVVISARVRLLADYLWTSVEPAIRAKLLDIFSFEHREFGQPMFQSEVLGAIQGVGGVDYVALEVMGGVGKDELLAALIKNKNTPENFIRDLKLNEPNDIPAHLAQINPKPKPGKPFLPAELVFIDQDIPESLILNEVKQ